MVVPVKPVCTVQVCLDNSFNFSSTVFPRIVSAETILFWNCSQFKKLPQYFNFLLEKLNFCCGNYTRKYGSCISHWSNQNEKKSEMHQFSWTGYLAKKVLKTKVNWLLPNLLQFNTLILSQYHLVSFSRIAIRLCPS